MKMEGMQSVVLSVLRMIAGFLFASHGAQKLLGMLGGHRVPLESLLGVAAILEFVGGILVFLGLFTRASAFLLCGEMAVAYFRAHASRGFNPVQNGGELAVLYCFVFLFFFVAGGGALSLDTWWRRKK
jgi:putative oxidoreductase